MDKTEYRQNRITSYILQFNQFLGDEKSHSPNGWVICDLHSPDTFDTRLGERASANVQPWHNHQSSVGLKAQLEEHRTSIAEVWVQIPIGPEFFRPNPHYCVRTVKRLWGSDTSNFVSLHSSNTCISCINIIYIDQDSHWNWFHLQWQSRAKIK